MNRRFLIISALLEIKLPTTASPVRLVGLLLLLVLLHGEDVIKQPLEDDGVAVDGDIDLVLIRYFLEALVKVFHVFDEQTA